MTYEISFDKSNEDIPVLTVATTNYSWLGQSSLNVVNVITGQEAIDIWNKLTKKEKKKNYEFPPQTVEAISGVSPV